MATIAERIMLVVDAKGGNKSEFARKINVTPAYISKLGKFPDTVPSDRTIADICREFNVNETWLRTGEGEMFVQRSRDEELASFFGDVLKGEDPDFRRRLLAVMSRMTTEQWEMLEEMALKLVEEMKRADP